MTALTKLRECLDAAEKFDELLYHTHEAFPPSSRQNGVIYDMTESMVYIVQRLHSLLHYQELASLPCTCDCKTPEPSSNHAFACPRFIFPSEEGRK